MLLEPCGSSVQRIFKGVQYDRITAVWLDDANFFRTSTAAPTINDVLWTVTKDVTRYSSLLVMGNISLSVMLENLVDNVYTGVYHVNVTFLYYDIDDMCVPLSSRMNRKLRLVMKVKGFWFRIQSNLELHGKSVIIPKNTYKVVMEISVSFHGYDKFWYLHPPDSYIRAINLTRQRGHRAYREVLLNIDENLLGTVVPFPIIYPDKQCTGDFEVQAKIIDSGTPDLEMEQPSSFEGLDRSCEVETKRKSQYYGWVKSSVGNLTTTVSRELKLKNKIKFYEKGNEKKFADSIFKLVIAIFKVGKEFLISCELNQEHCLQSCGILEALQNSFFRRLKGYMEGRCVYFRSKYADAQ
ncbi:hypothetical protein T459_34877 [Capsicum annuum]|uniref:Peptide N-acetyl-beta-D-glucosaminyl asparaginase amidase A N-terminal domain-containing protein n=1 Tax=Capsicum annuum TaxID=4072 RepID=A0A2G2XUW1_CAPAN|nr:hypothetical protein T459_34877 [Capsicum annuum]